MYRNDSKEGWGIYHVYVNFRKMNQAVIEVDTLL